MMDVQNGLQKGFNRKTLNKRDKCIVCLRVFISSKDALKVL